jgi:CHAT domain-containing protein
MEVTPTRCRELLDESINIWNEAELAGRQPQKLVPRGKKVLEMKKRIDLDIDFSDPYHWAVFSLSGNGHLIFTRVD